MLDLPDLVHLLPQAALTCFGMRVSRSGLIDQLRLGYWR